MSFCGCIQTSWMFWQYGRNRGQEELQHSQLARAISHSTFFRLIQSIPLPGKWQHCRDSLKLHFDGHSGLSLPLTSVVKLWPPGHFGGVLSALAKRRESDGRTKEMICGQSSTLMLCMLSILWLQNTLWKRDGELISNLISQRWKTEPLLDKKPCYTSKWLFRPKYS